MNRAFWPVSLYRLLINKENIMVMDIQEIFKYLPHRYPFLLVDRVLELEEGKRILALKNITFNEPQFTGHFPDQPVFPGVLTIEALAQAAGILSFKTMGKQPDSNSTVYIAGIDNVRFKKPVVPGDQLLLEVAITRNVRNIWKYAGVAKVGDEVVVEAEIMCALKVNG